MPGLAPAQVLDIPGARFWQVASRGPTYQHCKLGFEEECHPKAGVGPYYKMFKMFAPCKLVQERESQAVEQTFA